MNKEQREEIESLEGIYEDSLKKISRNIFQLTIDESGVTIGFSFPKSYPKDSSPKISSLNVKNLKKTDELKLLTETRNEISMLKGDSCMFDIIQFVTDHELVEKASCSERYSEEEEEENDNVIVGIWFHHVRNPKKKKEIINRCRNNGITGIYKWGKPGYCLLFGNREFVEDWIKHVRTLHWKKMTIRFRLDYKEKSVLFKNFFEVYSESEIRKELSKREVENVFDLLTHMNNDPFKHESEVVPSCIQKKSTSSQQQKSSFITIAFRVKPNARKNSVLSIDQESVNLSVSKPAKNNMANTEVVRYLSQVLGEKKSRLRIVSGGKSREKVVRIDNCNLSASDVFQKLKNNVNV